MAYHATATGPKAEIAAKRGGRRLACLDILEPKGVTRMKDWRCLVGRHDWRVVTTGDALMGARWPVIDRDKYSECTRCGKHDFRRHLARTAGSWRGDGNMGAGGDGGSGGGF